MMQQQELHRDLRDIFRQRVRESFQRARQCLSHARMARCDGDSVNFRKWIWLSRVFRMAAANWRERARGVL